MKKFVFIVGLILIFGCSPSSDSLVLFCTWDRDKYTFKIDKEKQRVFIEVKAYNPSYDPNYNRTIPKEFRTEQYSDVEKWSRRYHEYGQKLVWHEKYGKWELDRSTLRLDIKPTREGGAPPSTFYCSLPKI